MSDELDPLTTGGEPAAIGHKAILIAMAVLIVLIAAGGGAARGGGFAIGVLFGGVLAFVNYLWLNASTKALFGGVAGRSAGLLAIKYILRYAAIGLVLWLVYMTGAFPIVAVILGLSAFAFAVVAIGLKNIFTSSL